MRLLKYLKNDMYLELLCFFFFVLAFTLNNPLDTFNGFYKIFTSSSILLTDYVFVGGIGAAFLNVAINLLFNIILIKILKIEVSGPIFAGMMMIVGFSFFGKNIFNGLPIYLGVWLFSKMKKKPFQNYIITLLFSSGLSPIVSYSIFGFGLPYYFSIPLGIIVGIIVGILIPQFAAHTISFHQGYNLYNTGFALGIISCVFYGLFLLCGLNVEAVKEYDSTNYWVFYYILGTFILGCVIIYYMYLCYCEYKVCTARFGNTVYARGKRGLRKVRLYCPKEKIGEIKIYRYPVDPIYKTCNIKITIRSEPADSMVVRHLDYEDTKKEIFDCYGIKE